MKTIITAVLIAIFSQISYAQNLDFEWVKKIGDYSSGTNIGRSIITDANGNVYTIGSFQGTADFDPGTGTYNLISAGDNDIFFQKLDSAGNFIWAKRMGGIDHDLAYSISIDTYSNLYITGYFEGTADFDPDTGTTYLTSSGNYDIFIQKFDAAGNFLWVKQTGGASTDYGRSIVVDSNANIYTTGHFSGTVDFDPGIGTAYLSTPNSNFDAFIQKLDSAGNFIWAKRMGGLGQARGLSLSLDANSNIHTTGWFSSTIDFDPGVGISNLTSVGGFDVFILKLDSSGNFIWVNQIGSTQYDYGYSIANDSYGNVYTTGMFYNTVDFDPGSGVTNLTSAGLSDYFIQKLDTAGNLIWAKQMGSTDYDRGSSIVIDKNDNVYVTGTFVDTVDFDPGSGTHNLISHNGSLDIFIQKIDASGNLLSIEQIKGTNREYPYSITTDYQGNIYTTGQFELTADFDPGPGTASLSVINHFDVYILKLSQCPMDSTTDTIVACNYYTWIDGITYTSSNNTSTYTLTNYHGCDSIITLKLTIDTVDTGITSNDPIITANANGATYQWLDCNNNYSLILGSTSQNFIATANGDYSVEVTQIPCIDTSICISISTVNITENILINKISVSPNPVTNQINIKFEKQLDRKHEIAIFNIFGQQLIYKQIDGNTKYSLDVSTLKSGMYFYSIISDGQVLKSDKFIKQ